VSTVGSSPVGTRSIHIRCWASPRQTLSGIGLCLLALTPGACGGDEDWPRYSVAPSLSQEQHGRFPDSSGVRLKNLYSIGSLDGAETNTFAFISDASLGPDGTVFVADIQAKRVAVYDSSGQFKRWFGRAGSGPGEFISPRRIAVFDTVVAIFDSNLLRVSVFDTSGSFRYSFALNHPYIEDFSHGRGNEFVFTAASRRDRVDRISQYGQLLRRYEIRSPIDSILSGPYAPSPGSICVQEDDNVLIYANSWIHEIAAFDDSGSPIWAKRWNSEALAPRPSNLPGVQPVVQRSVTLGIACFPEGIALAYLDRTTGHLTYEFFNGHGEPLARYVFSRPGTADYPGALGAVRRSRMVTFRTRPFPQVFVYELALGTR